MLSVTPQSSIVLRITIRMAEFISSFKIRVQKKILFDKNVTIKRLIFALKGEAKQSVEFVVCNGIFYGTA